MSTKEKISLSDVSTVANYIESVYNLIYDADEYIRIFHKSLPELYRTHKNGACKCVVIDEAVVFLLSESDKILKSKCIQFAVDTKHLVDRKFYEVSDYLNKMKGEFIDTDIRISQDLILYFSTYQQQLNWDNLSSGNYGDHIYDGLNIYNLEEYASKRREEFEGMRFNNILNYKFNLLIDVIDFGYRESVNTFTKLRRILEESTSLYASLMLLHVYIDIMFLMCYIVEYVYNATATYRKALQDQNKSEGILGPVSCPLKDIIED